MRKGWIGAAALLLSAVSAVPAGAVVSGRPAGPAGAHVVAITGPDGLCSGTAIAADLVLSAAHCFRPGATYGVLVLGGAAPEIVPVAKIVPHPGYNAGQWRARRATMDLALVKLARPLPPRFAPAALSTQPRANPGAVLTVAGYGHADEADRRSDGRLAEAALTVIGSPSTYQVRLADPAGLAKRPGAGACTGDSGGPAFVQEAGRLVLAGVISWTTGAAPKNCGLMTGTIPIAPHRAWIAKTARELGSGVR